MVTDIELYEPPHLNALVYLWGWIKSDVYKTKRVNETSCSLAFWMLLLENKFRQTTHDFRTRVFKCTEVDGGIFEHLM